MTSLVKQCATLKFKQRGGAGDQARVKEEGHKQVSKVLGVLVSWVCISKFRADY